MGSSNSRLGSRTSRPRFSRAINRRFSSLICGGSTSRAPVDEMDEFPAELLECCADGRDPIVINKLQSSKKDYPSMFSSETGCSSSTTENGASPDVNNDTIVVPSTAYRSRCVETSNDGKCMFQSKELVPNLENADISPSSPYLQRTSDVSGGSSKEQCPELLLGNVGASLDAVVEASAPKSEVGPQIFLEGVCSSSTSHQELGDSSVDGVSLIENPANDVLFVHNSDSSTVPGPSVTSQPLADETAQEAVPPGPEFLMSDSQQDGRNGSVLHVDVVGISSNSIFSSSGEISNREARRSSRRLFWDAFSRRSSRRHGDSRTIVFSSGDNDDLGSHNRWLLDFNGDLFGDGVGSDSGYLGSRNHGTFDGQWRSRSEIWERFRGGLDEGIRQTTFCATGLHPDGTCSCESFLMAEESGTRGSISRIVMLAEALFEVLDEIHRQPMSLSLSMVSVPAPESVVNSFPLKRHKKLSAAETGDDAEQCYICLAEYVEGDDIRVLPCHHEYHMSCVDKWLKEIHGVCPLCRGNVCEGAAEGSISNL